MVLLSGVAALVAVHVYAPAPSPVPPAGIPVVAAESFWGSLLSQLGGSRVHVHTIVSDPNADPHEYEINVSDAIAVADARLVIENGAGYDDWCQQMVNAAGSPGPTVLNVADLLGKQVGDNPHFWYGASYVNASLARMYADLVAIDPTGAAYYASQYAALNRSLNDQVFSVEAEIRGAFAGAPVSSTETIFGYLAESLGLALVSPVAFMTAVSQGNDPPAASITAFEDQLTGGQLRLLVYNAQTVTPLTDQMRSVALRANLPVVALTETLSPANATFQSWMGLELLALQAALASSGTGGGP